MLTFDDYLNKFGEVGYTSELFSQVAFVEGLPTVRIGELVEFEGGASGQVYGFEKESVEVVLLNSQPIKAGGRVTRTGNINKISVGNELLGTTIDPLARIFENSAMEKRSIDRIPVGLAERTQISKPLSIGTTIVDIAIPLGLGQRELVIGDRGTGKSMFLQHVALTAARKGIICIYALIGKKAVQATKVTNFFKEEGVSKQTVIVATSSSDPAGLIFLTPYSAMTIAEYFKDQGKDTIVILDDLTNHAKFYREITLLLRRFPGRSSYPGDIFYIHSRLLERAGNFQKASISCFPVAETTLGELSGFIQTNIMSITDGHLFFDKTVFNEGRKPAVNPHLSVTRVGYKVQIPLVQSTSREVSKFLFKYKRLRDFLHFGAETGYSVQLALKQGEQLMRLFNQPVSDTTLEESLLLIGLIWSTIWKELSIEQVAKMMTSTHQKLVSDTKFKNKIEELVGKAKTLNELSESIKLDQDYFLSIT